MTFHRQALPAVHPGEFVVACKLGSLGWMPGSCGAYLDVVLTEKGLCYTLDPQKHFPKWMIEDPGMEAGMILQLSAGDWSYQGQADTMGVGVKVSYHELNKIIRKWSQS